MAWVAPVLVGLVGSHTPAADVRGDGLLCPTGFTTGRFALTDFTVDAATGDRSGISRNPQSLMHQLNPRKLQLHVKVK